MIEFNPDVRRLLAVESFERRAVAYRSASAPGPFRRGLGRVLLTAGARLAAEPPRPTASDLRRAGAAPGAWRTA